MDLKKIDLADKNSQKATFIFSGQVFKKLLILSIALLVVRYFFIQPFFVSGVSMENTFKNKDILLINKTTLYSGKFKRGDVVLFKYPKNPKEIYIKRIVAFPGEKIEIKNNIITIYNSDKPSGFVLKENYITQEVKTLGDISLELKDGEYFVLGDNREHSSDSRHWGPLNIEFILGRVFLRAYPLSKISIERTADYN